MKERIKFISKVLLLASVVLLFTLSAPRTPESQRDKTVLNIWHPWGGPMLETFSESNAIYNRRHPEIIFKPLFVPLWEANSQKFVTAVIGDVAPEVAFIDGSQLASFAGRGFLQPLDSLIEAEGYSLDTLKSQFFGPCWKQCVYKGKVYGITHSADPNFCLFWNKGAIRKAIESGEIPAGVIDPDKPPRTLAEMDQWDEVVTKEVNTGAGTLLTRMGVVPWGVYGTSNSLFTWGWAFGGEFYDEASQRVTPDDPHIIKALDWMAGYARKYGYEHIATLQSNFGSADQDPFLVGRQWITLYHLSGIDNIRRYAANLDFGLAPIPMPEGGETNSSWIGGWALAIPRGIVDPVKRKAAIQYIIWNCITPEGTGMTTRSTMCFPGWKKSPYYDEARKDPQLRPFVEILENCKHQRPVMPAQSFFYVALGQAVDHVVRGELKENGTPWTSQEALADVRVRSQRELDRVLSQNRDMP